MVARDDLVKDALNLFWWFVCERQRIWYRRVVEKENPPWTEDEILQKYRFTNVYRELDPGTQYAIQNILEREESKQDKIFNVMIYRLIGRSETHDCLGFQRISDFDPELFESKLKKRRDQQEPVFTGAYMVSGYNGMGSSDKVENVTAIFEEIVADSDAVFERILTARDLRGSYQAVRSLLGFGDFLSYQVLVDLLYPLKVYNGQSLLPYSPDDWSKPGPGAQKGLKILRGNAEHQDLEIMRWLRTNQTEEFNRLELDFPHLRNGNGTAIELSLANIQNCLCEFYKYHKIETGDGRARRRFRTSESSSREELRGIYRDALQIEINRSRDFES